jgi:hypothetical protein
MSESDTTYANIIRQNAPCTNKWKWHTKAKSDINHHARRLHGCERLKTYHSSFDRIE